MKVTIFLFLLLTLSSSQLLGIDLGTMYTKVAMVQPGAGLSFAILQNTKSQRKIQTAISFNNQHRFYQQDALSKRTKSTTNSFLYTKMFIDLIESPQQFQEIQKDYLLTHKIQSDKDLLNFIVQQGFGDKLTISIQQIFGMIFKHIKDLAQKVSAKGTKVQDCVLTVPYHWNLRQRILLINALKIAQLNPLYIVTQNTAAAVHYGVNRQFNTTHKVLFYNLGASYLQMSVVQFKKSNTTKKGFGQIYILGSQGLQNVGGLKFDLIVKNKLKKIFFEKNKKQLSSKGEVRLLGQSKKIKQILSANKQAHVAIEELDGIDFKTIVSRNDFEHASQDLLKQITKPIVPLLKSLDLAPSDIKYVQLIGGSIRMPKIQELLIKQFPESEVGTHINGDESMAFGSAFLAANSSKKYKVKGLHLYDGFHNFDILVKIKNLDQSIEQGDANYISKTVKVFKKGQRFGLIKDVLLKTKANVVIDFIAEYQNQEQQLIKRIKTSNITGYKQIYPDSSPKLMLSLRTHSVNVVEAVEIKLNIVRDEQVAYFEQVKKPESKKSTKKQKQQEKQQQEKEKSDQQKQKSTSQDGKQKQKQQQKQNKTKTKKNKTESEPEQKYQTVRKTRIVQKTHSLKLKTTEQWLLPPIFDENELTKSRSILRKFQKQQHDERKLAEAKNKLEAAIYQAQDLVENDWFKQHSTNQQIDHIKQEVVELQDKIYEQLDTNTFNDLYKEFYKNIQKIKIRRKQLEERQRVKKSVESDMYNYKRKFQKLQQQSDWLTEQDKTPFIKTYSQIQGQIQQSYQKLQSTKKNIDPPVLNKQILKLVDKVKQQFMRVSTIQKPKKAKKAKEQKEVKENKQNLDEL